MKKVTAFIMFLMVVSTAVLGCTDKPETKVLSESTAETKTAESTGDDVLKPDVPQSDFDGYDFRFLVRNAEHMIFVAKDIYAESENGDLINDAVYRRNIKIEEACNFVVSQNAVLNPGIFIQKIINAGDDEYDTFIESTVQSVQLSKLDMVYDLHEIPYLDFTRPWWDAGMTEELSVGNKLYCNMGELIISDNDGTWGVLFNKNIMANYNLENPYELVNKGEWTIEKMHELSAQVSVDINNDGKMSIMDDRFGFATEPYNTFVMVVGAGERIITKDENDLPSLTMNTQKYIAAYEKALALNTDELSTCNAAKVKETNDPFYSGIIPAFNDGRVMFYMGSMALVPLFRDMNEDFGLLPTPKLDTVQEQYISTMSVWNNGAVYIPVTNTDTERTGIVIEALSAESMYTLTPAYYDLSLKTKFARDDESAAMLDIIFRNRVIDMGATYNFGNLADIVMNAMPDFSSEYAKREERALLAIDKFITGE
ncbi:MAG: hypothetical protein PHZ09_05830 [Eubacteriales bacterium]|nr:hypothetical protein [Eubacteriales bacterium]